MEKKLECTILENKKEYAILEKIKKEDQCYMYLFNVNNPKDFCIRKLVGKNICGLDSDEEFDEALLMLREKNKDLIEKLGL